MECVECGKQIKEGELCLICQLEEEAENQNLPKVISIKKIEKKWR